MEVDEDASRETTVVVGDGGPASSKVSLASGLRLAAGGGNGPCTSA